VRMRYLAFFSIHLVFIGWVAPTSAEEGLTRKLAQNPTWYTCGNRNDPTNTQCDNSQNCCRAYHTANPYNYCCPGNQRCDGEGGCR
jgi:hypothetical protein